MKKYYRNKIIKFLSNDIDKIKKENYGTFFDTVNIEDLQRQIYCLLNKETAISSNMIDMWFFRCDNVGYKDDKILNYIEVVALEGTKEIISIYPIEEPSNLIDRTKIINIKKSKIKKLIK